MFKKIFFLVVGAIIAASGYSRDSKIFLEDVQVDKRFDYFKVYNPKHKGKMRSEYYWERKNWANPKKIESVIKEHAKSDTSNTFIRYSEIDEETVFLHLYLDHFYLNKENDKIVVVYRYDATDYLGNLIRDSEKEEIKADYLDLGFFSLTGYLLAHKIVEQLEKDFAKIEVEKVKELDELAVFSSKQSNNNQLNKGLENNSVSFFYEDAVISGVLLSDEGYALTDYRLFRFFAPEDVKVVLSSGDTSTVELVRVNKIHNLALVKITNLNGHTCQKLNLAGSQDIGDQVFFWGTPGNLQLINSFATGIVSGNIKRHQSDYYFVDTMPHWGYTGSAVFNQRNELIGVALLISFDQKSNLVMPCVNASQLGDVLKLKL